MASVQKLFSRVLLTSVVSALSVTACSSKSSPATPASSQLVLDYSADFSDVTAFYNAPYPSDLRLNAAGQPDLHGFPNQTNAIIAPLVTIAQDRKGFPTVPTAFFQFTQPVATQDPEASIPAGPPSGTLLVDIDPTSPDVGTFYPTAAHSLDADVYTPANVLAVAGRPGIVLAPLRKYAFVVVKELNDANGAPLGVSDTMSTLAHGGVPAIPRGADLQALYAPLWPVLTSKSVSLDDVVAATVFTTGDVVKDTFDLSTAVKAAYSVTLRNLAVRTDGDQDRNCEITGVTTYPQFQQGTAPFDTQGTFAFGSDGLPVKQADQDAPLAISLPKGVMPVGGYPLVAFFHGSGGLSTAVFDRGPILVPNGPDVAHQGPAYVLAPHGIAAAGSALPLNPERFPGATETEYLNLNNLAAFRDTFRQGVIEQRLFIEALRTLTIDPAIVAQCTNLTLPPGETAFHFNANQLLGQGQSMGGMYTNMISAVEPRILASVPTGAGGFWSYFILKTSVVPNAGTALGALLLGTRAKMSFMHPALAVGETGWEPCEPMVYMPRLARRPLDGHPTRPIYEPVGVNDSYFPEEIYDAIALAYGHKEAGDVQWTTMQDALKLEGLDGIIPYPVSNDVTSLVSKAPYTGMIVQYHEDDIDPDGHDIYKQLDSVKYQYGCFFESFLKTGIATVPPVNPLGTACPM